MAQTTTHQLKTNLTPWLVNENDFPHEGSTHDQLQFLLRYAVLAQSFYNTQPWEFTIEDSQINVYANQSRWLKTSDPDQRELYLSVGCALENLLIAAEHFHLGHQISRFPEPHNNTWVARVNITTIDQSSALRSPALFSTITKRHTHHHRFDSRPLNSQHLMTIKKFLTEEDIWLQTSEDTKIRDKIAQYAAHANTILFSDKQFLKELNDWTSEGELGRPWLEERQAKTGESGEQTASKGETRGAKRSQQQKPSTPATAKRLNHQEQSILKTAPLTAVLSSPFDNHMIHVIAGQIFQKLCLEAALLGIRCLPLNQLIEVTESRAAVADLFPAMKGEPLVVFAMGYGEEETEKDWTPRLPFEQVLH